MFDLSSQFRLAVKEGHFVTKSLLSDTLAGATGLDRSQAAAGVDAILLALTKELKTKGSVNVQNFGTFKLSKLGRRQSRNPRTGEPMIAAASRTVRFAASASLREEMKKARVKPV